MYNDYISSMLTPFSVDEVNLKIQRTRYKVSTKCGDDKTFYRFGFNGQEKDEEIKGRRNVMSKCYFTWVDIVVILNVLILENSNC